MAREIGENKMAVSQRQIKFRAWDGERMITESLVKEYDAYNLLTLEGERISHLRLADEYWNYESANKNPLIWLQFTGLKDKHGTEIFEGDVLKKMGVDYDVELDYDADPDAEYPIIEIDRDVATMERFPVFWLNNEAFGYEGEDLENPDEWEIIGNVFENPELLEKQK